MAKFLYVNPMKSWFTLQDLHTARIFLLSCKQPLNQTFILIKQLLFYLFFNGDKRLFMAAKEDIFFPEYL